MIADNTSFKTFWSGDLHLSHQNIIKYCNRPFKDTVEMNNTIIDNWNKIVGPNDLIYNLGDFCFGNDDNHFNSLLKRLNGYHVFIKGNHDKVAERNKDKFYQFHYGYHEATINGQFIVMCHYPILSWNKKHRGSIMLHGHCHYNLPSTRKESTELGKIVDVGTDGNNFKPYSFDDIMKIMKDKPIEVNNKSLTDHHKTRELT